MVHAVTIEIGNRKFLTNLIVLPGLGLDVIMGMSWMQHWGVVIDTANRTLTLSELQGGGTFQVLLPRSLDLQNVSCATQVKNLLDIPVVCKFSDVFPDELPGLPPDWDVEFAIKLVPGMAPISRRPYRMPPNELAELKIQLQELLDKGLI
jgi:hypothetical protein